VPKIISIYVNSIISYDVSDSHLIKQELDA